MKETIFQHWLLTDFVFPFLLMFFILFAILEKTKVFGDDKKQLNALLSFVVALIFVGAVFPKIVVGNLILFLTIAIVFILIGLILWGFIIGGEAKIENKYVKIFIGIVLTLVLIGALLWATNFYEEVINFFKGILGSSFWINLIFAIVVAAALAIVIKLGK